MMGHVTDADPTLEPDLVDDGPRRSGTTFVIATGVFLVVFLILILVVGPRLQDQMGLSEGARDFEAPPAPVTATLTLDGAQVGVATWNAEGVCAEVTDRTGTTFRTCATPDPLRPIWAIDAPDEADPPYVIVASPPAVASLAGRTADGEALNGLTQARELPAAWTLIPLPDGAQVSTLVAFNSENSEMGDVVCGTEESSTDGPERLVGGCYVERQD